jgi:hypothetical protein
MPRRLLALLLVLPALAGGCGGDDESQATPKPPELTVPETDGETGGGTTETTPEAPAGGGPGGGAPAPSPPDPPASGQPDSPQNDLPPQPGTPESRFEEFCERNPGACG